MKAWLPLIIVAALCVPSARAQDPLRGPGGPAPLVVTVGDVSKERGEFIYEQTRTEIVYVTETAVIEQDGMKRTIARRVMKMVPVLHRTKHRLADCEFQTGDGKKVRTEDVLNRLSKGMPLLVVPVGGQLDPAYRAILRADALILLPKTGGAPVREKEPLPK